MVSFIAPRARQLGAGGTLAGCPVRPALQHTASRPRCPGPGYAAWSHPLGPRIALATRAASASSQATWGELWCRRPDSRRSDPRQATLGRSAAFTGSSCSCCLVGRNTGPRTARAPDPRHRNHPRPEAHPQLGIVADRRRPSLAQEASGVKPAKEHTVGSPEAGRSNPGEPVRCDRLWAPPSPAADSMPLPAPPGFHSARFCPLLSVAGQPLPL